MGYPKSLLNLIECYKRLPGIGEKTAERMALATLRFDEKTIDTFSESIKNVKYNIKRCKRCNNYTEDDLCSICSDESRNHSLLCVLEDPKNINIFEKMDIFEGVYHVLDGLISPLNGINPDDIKIKSLFKRVDEENIKEIIIAVKPSIEGETTSLYISKMLEDKDVIVSKIASGVPMGTDIDYLDSMTLEMALEDRKKISNNNE
jgi:recombination protein RecR